MMRGLGLGVVFGLVVMWMYWESKVLWRMLSSATAAAAAAFGGSGASARFVCDVGLNECLEFVIVMIFGGMGVFVRFLFEVVVVVVSRRA